MASRGRHGPTGADAATVAALVAAQMDRRFTAMDLSAGTRIDWAEVSQGMNRWRYGNWPPSQCQRLWRAIAYGDDVGLSDDVLPDSDGEDDLPPMGACARVRDGRE